MSAYKNLGDIAMECAAIFQPPERLTVSEASTKYVMLHNPPAYNGPYKRETTPYMDEPMDTYTSRRQTGLVFVGPAQCAKTQGLLLNTIAYTIKCNPADAILYCPSQAAARDFSRRRIDRLHRHSPALRDQLLPGQHADNTFDKFYKSGMILTLSWPSVNEMAGKPVPITILTDYDRMPMDVDGEGAPFKLAQQRIKTFRSLGITVAESSPSKDITDPKWKGDPEKPHLAPPCEGILGLYNGGDRRRWHWPCPECGEYFEGSFALLDWDRTKSDPYEASRTCWMRCPVNACVIMPEKRYSMNARGKWIKEGQRVDRDGVIHGTGIFAETASFWLKGVAAAFSTWQELVSKYLIAEADYASNGSQDALRVTVNTDQGEPYLPRGLEGDLVADELASCATPLPERAVPSYVRALIAACDVQKSLWEVQVFGVHEGNPFDLTVIDRFSIIKSNRLDEEGDRLWVKPADHPEDWDLLITEVMDKTYPLEDGSGDMAISVTLCDSGGREGVTANAYLFYQKLKAKGRHDRFQLIKGDGNPNSPRVRIEYPDSQRKDRLAKARGEVPVLMLNTNVLKDAVVGMLPAVTYTKDGELRSGRIHFPKWLPESFYEQYTVEVREPKGWTNKAGRRNESFDLTVYALGACLHRRIEKVDWSVPPPWLFPQSANSLVIPRQQAEKAAVAAPAKTHYGRAQLGEALG